MQKPSLIFLSIFIALGLTWCVPVDGVGPSNQCPANAKWIRSDLNPGKRLYGNGTYVLSLYVFQTSPFHIFYAEVRKGEL